MRLPTAIFFCLLSLFTLHYSLFSASPIRPLAQNHIILDNSPDPKNIPLYTPTILALESGRLVAAHERSGTWPGNQKARIYTSDDHGASWTLRKAMSLTHARLFKAGNNLYYLGHSGKLSISKSTDNGTTWSNPVTFTTGLAKDGWHQSACNVLHSGGYVYLVMENQTNDPETITGWGVGTLAPVLMRANENLDLTQLASWTFADAPAGTLTKPINEYPFSKAIPGYEKNTMPSLNNSGIPFYVQTFPNSNNLSGRSFSPLGWLETNIAKITAPTHPWYDPAQKTIHLFMRANTGTTNIAAIAKVTENPDGTMTTSLVQSPSGVTQLFLPFPGGQMRFHILQDPQTNLYWLLGSQTTYSMTRSSKLSRFAYGLPDNQRQRLVLHFSKDLIRWNFAGVVAIGDSPNSARHYASMDIDGDDIIVLSRSGDAQAKTAHDGNICTFHRVKNFRSLVY